MKFKEVLNKYLKELNCSSKKLSTGAGLSQSVISRYRSGERTPVKESEQMNKLITALFNIAQENGQKKYTLDKIKGDFNSTLPNDDFDYTTFSNNLNTLIMSLKININEMSKFIIFDASHISRIRYGKAKPSNPIEFSNKICSYIFTKYNNPEDISNISTIIGCKKSDLSENKFINTLFSWLTSETKNVKNEISDFLYHLDSFNLDDYIKAIKFDELKVPYLPFYKAKNKNYYGIEEMKNGELNFFKATVLSKSKEDIFMCSDMPMEDMAQDVEFGKKWMYAIAIMLKKGLHLNIIHNVDRPFNEMMLGLESWLPIYMTGQVSPYFLKGLQNNIYCHFNYVSGVAALYGECINGYHDKGKYTLTTNKNDISYYKTKAQCLLSKATSLMDIYKADSQNSFNAFLSSSIKIKASRRRILFSLPIHTISNNLLFKILKHNNVSAENIKAIQESVEFQKEIFKNTIEQNVIEDEISILSKEEFGKVKPFLFLADIFYDKKIYYTYEDYLEHINLTKKYEKENKNYKLSINNNNTFKNIQILVCEKNWVMISKANSPSIHFVIHHPKLRNAIENFIPPVVE